MRYPTKAVPKRVLEFGRPETWVLRITRSRWGITDRLMYPLYPLWPSRSPKTAKARVTIHANTYTGTDMRLAAVALNPNWARKISRPVQCRRKALFTSWMIVGVNKENANMGPPLQMVQNTAYANYQLRISTYIPIHIPTEDNVIRMWDLRWERKLTRYICFPVC